MKKPAGRAVCVSYTAAALRRARTSLARCRSWDSTGPRPQSCHGHLRILCADDGCNEPSGQGAGVGSVLRRRRGRAAAPAPRAGRFDRKLGRAAAGSGAALPRDRARSAWPRRALDRFRAAPSTADFAAVAAAVLEAEESGPAVVAGHSFGGLVALRLAHSRPELVRGLLLVVAGRDQDQRPDHPGDRADDHDDPPRSLRRAAPPSLRRARLVPPRGLPPVVRLGRAVADAERDPRPSAARSASTRTRRARLAP